MSHKKGALRGRNTIHCPPCPKVNEMNVWLKIQRFSPDCGAALVESQLPLLDRGTRTKNPDVSSVVNIS